MDFGPSRSQRRPRFRCRRLVKAAVPARIEKGAVYSPQAGEKLWILPCLMQRAGRKPSRMAQVADRWKAPRVSPISVALRGAPRDASPRPWVVGQREQLDLPTVPSVLVRFDLAQAGPIGPSFGSQAPSVNSGWDAAGGRRKPIVRGSADPKLRDSHAIRKSGFARRSRRSQSGNRLDRAHGGFLQDDRGTTMLASPAGIGAVS